MARLREVMQGQTEPKRIREITKPKIEVTVEALQKEVEEQRRKFAGEQGLQVQQWRISVTGGKHTIVSISCKAWAIVGGVVRHYTEFVIVLLPLPTKAHVKEARRGETRRSLPK